VPLVLVEEILCPAQQGFGPSSSGPRMQCLLLLGVQHQQPTSLEASQEFEVQILLRPQPPPP
jgi:hypothetical protein